MSFFGSIKSIDGLSANPEARLRLQKMLCSAANHFTVVDDENVFPHAVTFDLPRQVTAKKLESTAGTLVCRGPGGKQSGILRSCGTRPTNELRPATSSLAEPRFHSIRTTRFSADRDFQS